MNIAALALTALIVTGCGTYTKFSNTEEEPTAQLLRDSQTGTDSLTLSWRQMYAEPELQALIAQALEHNTDLAVAREGIRQAEASLAMARKAFLPSLTANLEGTQRGNVSSDKSVYTVSGTASWEVDIFGKLTAEKRGKLAALEAQRWQTQVTRTQVIANVATSYYTLLYLDRQIDISEQTIESWREQERMTESLVRAGEANTAALLQARAERLALEASLAELRRSAHETENSLCMLVGQPAGEVSRSGSLQIHIPEELSNGISLASLSARPDVRQQEQALAQAFYAVSSARAAFYPSLTLSGTLGWTNDGPQVTNPADWIGNAVASLTAPLFRKGQNRAQLAMARSQQEEARLNFRQTLRPAGPAGTDAYPAITTAAQASRLGAEQTVPRAETLRRTLSLFMHSSTNYLNVITAQQALLSARLSLAGKEFDRTAAAIKLYRSLGGGVGHAGSVSTNAVGKTVRRIYADWRGTGRNVLVR